MEATTLRKKTIKQINNALKFKYSDDDEFKHAELKTYLDMEISWAAAYQFTATECDTLEVITAFGGLLIAQFDGCLYHTKRQNLSSTTARLMPTARLLMANLLANQ